MTVHRRVQGDIDDTIETILDGVVDLDTLDTIEAHVWRHGGDAEVLTATVVDPDDRTILVELGDAGGWLSDAAVAAWRVEYEGTFADGSTLTWPAVGADWILVGAQGLIPAP